VAICADGSAAMPARYRAKACGRAGVERRDAEENHEQQRAHRPGNGSARCAQGTENGRHGSLPVRYYTVVRHSASNLGIVLVEIKRLDDGVASTMGLPTADVLSILDRSGIVTVRWCGRR
jgi:hypothetical protein